MTEFLTVDYYPHLSDDVMRDLQRRLARSNDNDTQLLREIYLAARLVDLIEAYELRADEAESIVINFDGTAVLRGGHFEGDPTYDEFIEYVRKGRGGR